MRRLLCRSQALLRSAALLCCVVSCAHHSERVAPLQPQAVPPELVAHLSALSDSFIVALASGDTARAQRYADRRTPWEILTNAVRFRTGIVRFWPDGHHVTGAHWLGGSRDTVTVSFAFQSRSLPDHCYPEHVQDSAEFAYVRHRDVWRLFMIWTPIC